MAAADALVLPNTALDIISARFTSPLKLFAYMASGKPILASDLPSIREVLDDTCAYFFTPDDAQNLARGVEKVLSDATGAAERGHEAREKVKAYSWKARAARILVGCAEAG
jgi:glycosyltransferase involved in cell wall biosynthesis